MPNTILQIVQVTDLMLPSTNKHFSTCEGSVVTGQTYSVELERSAIHVATCMYVNHFSATGG